MEYIRFASERDRRVLAGGDCGASRRWLGGATAALLRRHRKSVTAAFEAAGLASTPNDLDLLVTANMAHRLGYYWRTMRLAQDGYRSRLQKSFLVSSIDHLASALAKGQGAILVSAHIGDYDLAASWISQVFGSRPVVPVADLATRRRQAFYDRRRFACGLSVRHAADLRFAELARDLERGRIVILTLDRRTPRDKLDVAWFGTPASVSCAPYQLARRTGAPVLTALTWNAFTGSRVLRFGPPTVLTQTMGNVEMRAAAQRHVGDIEAVIRAVPAQWHVPTDLTELPWDLLQHRRGAGAAATVQTAFDQSQPQNAVGRKSRAAPTRRA